MASDVKAIESILERDKKARLSISEWIVHLARKINERPEDVVWFFNEMKRRNEWDAKLKEFERATKGLSPEELFDAAVKEAESSEELKGNVSSLLGEAKESLEKFERIEAKMKRIGVI